MVAATTLATKANEDVSLLNVHLGRVLFMVADTYPSIKDTIAEQVQNALDAEAPRIEIRVNVRKRQIDILDNGNGVTPKQFEDALGQVGVTQKKAGKLGRFGRGLVSPLDKCEQFAFTSRPRRGGAYRQWTFIPKIICDAKDSCLIPNEERHDIYNARRDVKTRARQGHKRVWWNTRISIDRYTADKMVSTMGGVDLARELSERYRSRLIRTNPEVTVFFTDAKGTESTHKVVPAKFDGTPLDKVELSESPTKKALFEVYLLSPRNKTRRGKLYFGERGDEYSITWQQFAFVAKEYISNDALEVLQSGLLEGEIRSASARIDPGRGAKGRGSFVRNDGLVDFLDAIEQWCTKIAKKHVAEAQSQAKERVWQEVGLEALKRFEGQLAAYSDVLDRFTMGSIGAGHADVGRKVTEKPHRQVATRGGENPHGKRSGQTSKSSQARSVDKKDRPGHHPLSSTGPRGQRRKSVRSDSLGIALDYQPITDSIAPCHVEVGTGTIIINTRHRHWSACEARTKTTLRRYVELVIPYALLTTEAKIESPDHEAYVAIALDRMLDSQVYGILEDSVRRRKKKDKED